jgi:hypothetical protein
MRVRTYRIYVQKYQVFYYPDVRNKREIFVHRVTEEGIMVSRHLQTGALFFTVNAFANVLVIGEADPQLEATITQLAQEAKYG